MKYCVHCGQSLIDLANFCSKCGERQATSDEKKNNLVKERPIIPTKSKLIKKCFECGKENDTSDRICSSCAFKPSPKASADETKRDWKVPTITMILVSLLLVIIFSNSNNSNSNFADSSESADSVTAATAETSQSDKPIDCSKIGSNATFSEIERCRSTSTSPENSTEEQNVNSISRSEEAIVRGGLKENCTKLPGNFSALRFQSRGSTFNNYGMPLDLYSLGNANLTFLDEGSTIRIGYADTTTQSILISWQCIFPFDTSR